MPEASRLSLSWTAAARLDLIRLRDFLESKNPNVAKRAAAIILKATDLILDNPTIAHCLEDREDRELFVPFGKNGYILRYRIEEDNILLLRIWHSREAR